MAEENHVVKKRGIKSEKVDDAIKHMDDEKIDDILSSFERFRSYLKRRINLVKKIGLNEEQLTKSAEKVGDYLASNVEPKNREEKLLQELWQTGNQKERHKFD